MPKFNLIRQINLMNRASFYMLSWGSFFYSLSLGTLSVELCREVRLGAADIIYRYPQMLEEITMPFLLLVGTALILDINAKRNR